MLTTSFLDKGDVIFSKNIILHILIYDKYPHLFIRDSDVRVLMTNNKKLEEYPILVTECDAVRHEIPETIRMVISNFCIHSD